MQIMLKTDMEDKKSLAGAWVEAARPRTLPASVSPVLLGCALAYYDGMFDITPQYCASLVALFAQIAVTLRTIISILRREPTGRTG